jgi:hypothetical protein
LPWPAGTVGGHTYIKKNTFKNDIILSGAILDTLSSSTLAELLQKMPYLLGTRTAPKEEVYDWAEYYTKTRNVFVLVSALSYIYMAFFQAPHKALKTVMDSPKYWNLVGFDFVRGGFNDFVTLLLSRILEMKPVDRAKECGFIGTMGRVSRTPIKHVAFIGVFSDNVFIIACPPGQENNPSAYTWFSCDGSKMEACHTYSMSQVYARYVLTDFWGKGGHDPVWEKIAEELFPHSVAYSQGILGSSVFRIPQMPSGVVATGYLNTSRMVLAVDNWLRNGAPWPGTQGKPSAEFQKLFVEAGVSIKVERSISDFAGACINDRYVAMDFLGYGAGRTKQNDSFIPVLEYSRLIKATFYSKTDVVRKFKEAFNESGTKLTSMMETQMENALEWVKLKQLWTSGGWFYTGLGKVMLVRLTALYDSFKRVGFEQSFVDEVVDFLLLSEGDKVSELAYTFLKPVLSLDKVPSMRDVYYLYTNQPIPKVYEVTFEEALFESKLEPEVPQEPLSWFDITEMEEQKTWIEPAESIKVTPLPKPSVKTKKVSQYQAKSNIDYKEMGSNPAVAFKLNTKKLARSVPPRKPLPVPKRKDVNEN